MAVATIPTLGGTPLPKVKEQPFRRMYRGGTLQMASGKIVHDLVDNTPRHSFRLEMILLTAAELSSVLTAWDAIKNTTATYVSIRNTSHTVTQPEGAEAEAVPVVTAAGDIKYNLTFELIEDS